METGPETEERGSGIARKLIVPAAISVAGSAVGLLLTQRKKVREAVSDLPVPHVPGGGVGEIAGDLKGKLDEVLGREPAGDTDGDDGGSRSDTGVDGSGLEQRRRERQERRDRRRQRSGR